MTLVGFYSQVKTGLPIYEFLVKLSSKDKDMRFSDPDFKKLYNELLRAREENSTISL
jgi:hypothetical protein